MKTLIGTPDPPASGKVFKPAEENNNHISVKFLHFLQMCIFPLVFHPILS